MPKACARCHDRKVRCEGVKDSDACKKCTTLGLNCTIWVNKDSVPPNRDSRFINPLVGNFFGVEHILTILSCMIPSVPPEGFEIFIEYVTFLCSRLNTGGKTYLLYYFSHIN
jgi:hypothetical protein